MWTVVTTPSADYIRFVTASGETLNFAGGMTNVETAEDENRNTVRTIGCRFTAAGDYTVKIESRGTTWSTETVDAAVKIFTAQAEADKYNNK